MCALGGRKEERAPIQPPKTHIHPDNQAMPQGRLEPLRSVIKRTRVLRPVPRKDFYGRQSPAEMMVEDGRPQVHQIRKNASDETSGDQKAKLGFCESDHNQEQDDGKGNIDSRRNGIRMRNIIHNPVLDYSRNKADQGYQNTMPQSAPARPGACCGGTKKSCGGHRAYSVKGDVHFSFLGL